MFISWIWLVAILDAILEWMIYVWLSKNVYVCVPMFNLFCLN